MTFDGQTASTAIKLALYALALLATGALLACVPPAGAATRFSPADSAAETPKLKSSHELWATVDVCKSKPTPQIGIRGSMPPEGQRKETMYMLFRVQYLDATTKQWTDLSSGGESGFVKMGLASTTRQTGRTFDLSLPAHGGAFQMRGVVEFQWRHGSHTTLTVTKTTSGGHHSAAGSSPRGYSSATCSVSG